MKLKTPKKFLFLLITILLFMLIVIGLEFALRLTQYGLSSSLIQQNSAHKQFASLNPEYGRRFFTSGNIRPHISERPFHLKKNDSSLRLVLLGGSSAAGYPYYYNATISNMLQDMMADILPERDIEVINLAMPAINSHALLHLVKKISVLQPDILLIYAGHNEFYGSFGAASSESFGQSTTSVQLYLSMTEFRLFQTLKDFISGITGIFLSPANKSDRTLMARMVANESIPWQSDVYKRGLEQFKSNLRQIIRLAGAGNTKIAISEVISNVAGQAPLSALARGRRQLLLQEAGSDRETSTSSFHGNLSLAERHYVKGLMARRQGRLDSARFHFEEALKYDELRFRAPPAVNTIIKEVCQQEGAIFVPTAGYFRRLLGDGLIDERVMLDHLHPSIPATFLIAKSFLNALIRACPELPWQISLLQNDQVYRAQSGITALDMAIGKLRIQILKSDWPFLPESNVSAFLQSYEPGSLVDKVALDYWRGKISWKNAHLFLARTYAQQGLHRLAVSEYRCLLKQFPIERQLLEELNALESLRP